MVDDDRQPEEPGPAREVQPSDEELWAAVRTLAEPARKDRRRVRARATRE